MALVNVPEPSEVVTPFSKKQPPPNEIPTVLTLATAALKPAMTSGLQSPPPRVRRLHRAAGPGQPQMVRQDAGRPSRRQAGLAVVHARRFGNRPSPLHLGNPLS